MTCPRVRAIPVGRKPNGGAVEIELLICQKLSKYGLLNIHRNMAARLKKSFERVYKVYQLKYNLTIITNCGTKIKPEAGPLPCNTLPTSSVTQKWRSTWLLGRCSHQLRKSCAGANTVCSLAERVFILEHFFALKSFAAVHEIFSNAYPDKEVPNKTAIHRLVTKFRDTGRVSSSQQIKTTKQLVSLIILMSAKLTNTVVVRVVF
jgi:hypothetical protein